MKSLVAGLALLSGAASAEEYGLRIDVDLSVRTMFPSDQQLVAWVITTLSDANGEFHAGNVQLYINDLVLRDADYPGAITQKLDAYRLATQDVSGIRMLFTALYQNAPTGAGVAVRDGLCVGEPVVVVSVPTQLAIRDYRAVELTIHEISHLFALDHSHCTNPPIDMCWSGPAPSCYTGPTSCPASQEDATVMSLCFNGACAPQLNSWRIHPVQLEQLINSRCRYLFKDGFEVQPKSSTLIEYVE